MFVLKILLILAMLVTANGVLKAKTDMLISSDSASSTQTNRGAA